jgi:hypothetical protein
VVVTTGLWSAVGALIDGASVEGVLAHKLGPLAAGRRRAAGEPVPEVFAAEERAVSFVTLSATPVLRRIRELRDGPLVLLKGPEVAALYPPHGRWFGDVDVLTPDAAGLHRTLLEHGFLEVETEGFDHSRHHHPPPLRWPVVPLHVEVHAAPNWPQGIEGPPLSEIIEASVPSVVGVEGISAPHRLHHALVLTAHAWSHEPLNTLRDLIDVAVLCADESTAELDRLAAAWGLRRIWRTTQRAIDALFYGGRRPAALQIWARHLGTARDRTVFESHLPAALNPFGGHPPREAVAQSVAAVRRDLLPRPGESWGVKLRRVPRAMRDAGVPRDRRRQ